MKTDDQVYFSNNDIIGNQINLVNTSSYIYEFIEITRT